MCARRGRDILGAFDHNFGYSNNNNLLNCSVYYIIFIGLDDLVRLQ